MFYIKLSYDETTLIEFNRSKLKIKPFYHKLTDIPLLPHIKTTPNQYTLHPFPISFFILIFYSFNLSTLPPSLFSHVPLPSPTAAAQPSPATSSTTNSNYFCSFLYCCSSRLKVEGSFNGDWGNPQTTLFKY